MTNSAPAVRTLANRAGHKVVDVKFCVDNPTAASPERLRAEFKTIKGALDTQDYVEMPLRHA